MKKVVLILLICLSFASCKSKDEGALATPCVINQTAISLMERQSEQLSITNLAVYGDKPKIVWTSNNKNVATVSDEGLVEAIAPGEANIYASIVSEFKTLSAACVVTVGNVSATELKVTIPADSVEIIVGDTVNTNSFEFTPLETSGQKVNFVRSDSVGEPIILLEITKKSAAPATKGEFKFIGLRPGTVEVQMKASDQKDISTKFTIVVKSIPAQSITIPSGIVVVSGKKQTIHAQLVPANATGKLKWKSTNEKYLKIVQSDADSVVVEGLLPYNDGNVSVDLLVTIDELIYRESVNVVAGDPIFPSSISAIDTVRLPLESDGVIPINIAPRNANVVLSSTKAQVDPKYKLPKDVKLANLQLSNIDTPNGIDYELYVTALFGTAAQGSMNAIQLSTAGKYNTQDESYAPEDLITSTKNIIVIVGKDIPETAVIMKSAYTFTDAKVHVTSMLTPVLATSPYTNIKANLYVVKGTEINKYKQTSLGILDTELKDGKLKDDKTIQTIELEWKPDLSYYVAAFEPFTKSVEMTDYRVGYTFDYRDVTGYNAVREISTNTAPYAPRR